MPVPFQASGAVVPSKGGGWETSQVWPSCWRGAKSQWVSETVTGVCTGRDVPVGTEAAGEALSGSFDSTPLHVVVAATKKVQIRRPDVVLVLTGRRRTG